MGGEAGGGVVLSQPEFHYVNAMAILVIRPDSVRRLGSFISSLGIGISTRVIILASRMLTVVTSPKLRYRGSRFLVRREPLTISGVSARAIGTL